MAMTTTTINTFDFCPTGFMSG